MPGFVLLVRQRGDDSAAMRYGITVTKKIGGAVVRNRMKRRLRELIRELLPERGVAGADHVLIGRAGGVERDFALLRAELVKALSRLAPKLDLPELVEGLPSSDPKAKKGRASTSSAKPELGARAELRR
jgi:ribonuclease P protein component